MPVIIDGHNLLWAVQNLEDVPNISEVALCQILDPYLGLIKQSAEIIFDGAGPLNKSGFETLKNIDVTFSGRSCDCDTIIEDRILASTAPKRLTIVSTDRRLRNAAGARKAISITSEDFWDEVKKRLEKHKPAKEPPGKRKGLTQSETELWLKTFGLIQ